MKGPFGLAEGWDPANVLTAINEALLTGVCITDRTGCFVSVSKGWCDIYGVEPDDVLGRHFTLVVPEPYRETATRMHDDFIEGGVEIPAEWQVRRPDGRPVWIRVGAARFHDRDGAPFKVTTVEDITARKVAEQALADSHARLEKLNRDKDRLFSIIGHDLRGPFNPILGYVDLMETLGESLTVPQALDYAGRIQEAAGHALALLDNLLEWSRLHVDARTANPKVQPLQPLVTDVARTMGSVADRKGIRVAVDIAPSLSARTDANMLTTVLRNLMSNALKFTPEGGSITLRGGTDGASVGLHVIDTGVGMAQESLDRILATGEAVSTPGTSNEPGTGLGLRVCREMLDRLGGRLTGRSVPGEGTTITVRLPHPDDAPGP
ncbi:PAS domain-containing sensor histidine kinase [Roseospira navarrensis]|nr:PAS domain-containing sensor histidine kinase [Roseospira navarrensis]